MSERLSLEEALRTLDEIVRQLESGEVSLDDAMQLFEDGQKLVRQCEHDLEMKELRLQKITEDQTIVPLE